MPRPRDSYRTKTFGVIEQIRADLLVQGLLPRLEEPAMDKRMARLQRSRLFREGLVGSGTRLRTRRMGPLYDLLDLAFDAAQSVLPQTVAFTGREFSSNYIKLIDSLLGKEAGKIARANFKAAGVKYSLPKNLSPEQRAAAADRMVQIKAKKVTEDLIAELREA